MASTSIRNSSSAKAYTSNHALPGGFFYGKCFLIGEGTCRMTLPDSPGTSEFIECLDHTIPVSHGAPGVAHAQHWLQSGRLCRVELGLEVRNKHNLLRRQRESSGNLPVTIDFGLCSRGGVKIG